jgi:hypothetical protein
MFLVPSFASFSFQQTELELAVGPGNTLHSWYTATLVGIGLLCSQSQGRCCSIGLGGGEIPSFLARQIPGFEELVVVESHQGVARAAEMYFGLQCTSATSTLRPSDTCDTFERAKKSSNGGKPRLARKRRGKFNKVNRAACAEATTVPTEAGGAAGAATVGGGCAGGAGGAAAVAAAAAAAGKPVTPVALHVCDALAFLESEERNSCEQYDLVILDVYTSEVSEEWRNTFHPI